MPEPGARLEDRYRLVEPVATGGMGEVWRGEDELLGRTVAVKLLHRRLAGDPGFGARFRGEARAMAALHHPNVADVYDYGETTDGIYIVMAWVDGPPLSDRIAEAGRLDSATTVSIVTQTARALQAVHDAGVVHRDVKPANLVVAPDGHVVLIDFGVAVTEGAPGVTAVNEVVGTALYMAPEQVAKRPVTPATDIYALGAVAYHCLAGHPPFLGDNALAVALRHLDDDPPPLPDDVDPALRALVTTAMAKEPTRRFPSAAAMADAAQAGSTFTHATATLPAPRAATPVPAAEAPRRRADAATEAPSRRAGARRAILGGALAGLAALAAVVLVADPTGSLRGPSTEPDRPPAATQDADPDPTGPDGQPIGGAGGQPVGTGATPSDVDTDNATPGASEPAGAPSPGPSSPAESEAEESEPPAEETEEPVEQPTESPAGEPEEPAEESPAAQSPAADEPAASATLVTVVVR
jgi:serine/threonine-protein kinase